MGELYLMSGIDEIGKAKITVEADISHVKDSMEDIGLEAENAATKVDSSSKKMKRSLSGVGETLEKLQSGLGKILIPAAVLGTVSAMVTRLQAARKESKDFVDDLKSAAKQMEVFRSDLLKERAGILDPETESVEEIYKRSIALQDQINEKLQVEIERRKAARQASSTVAFFQEIASGKTADDLVAEASRQIAAIDKATSEAVKLRRELNKTAEEERVATQKAADKERLEALKNKIDEISKEQELSLLPDDERIRANAEKQKNALIKAAEEANLEVENAKLQLVLENIDKAAERQIQKNEEIERKRAEDKEKRDREAAERTAKAAADAMERAMAPVIASLTSSMGTSFTTQLSGISNQIDDAVRELRKVKRGR